MKVTILKKQNDIARSERLFYYVPNLFTGSTDLFFAYVSNNKADHERWKTEIENIVNKYDAITKSLEFHKLSEAMQLHSLADLIRADIVEANCPKLKAFFGSVSDVFFDSMCDYKLIARELLRQYKENTIADKLSEVC